MVFVDASPTKKGQGLKGVHKHAKGYIVHYADEAGNKRAKLIKGSMQDVHAFEADPSSWIDEPDGEKDEEEEDEKQEAEAE